MPRVNPKSRIFAALIDGGVIAVVSIIVAVCVLPSDEKIAAKLLAESESFDQMIDLATREAAFRQRMFWLIAAVVALGYTSTEIVKSATVGKMIMGVRVARPNGSRADVVTLAKRMAAKNAAYLLYVVAFVTTLNFVIYLGWLAALAVVVAWAMCFRSNGLALYDELLGTDVLPAPRATAVSAQPAVA
jgi:uncharacterized RDD family membrane protein YckC